jgi:hypothetical protein
VSVSGIEPPPLSDPPAFYARPAFVRNARAREWWSLLHPPYTALHLSLVSVGACLAGPVNTVSWVATLLAFFFALGVAAHALDELNGRPLSTSIPSRQLVVAAALGLGVAVALGVAGCVMVTPYLAIFIGVGVFAALAYNLELFAGRLHTSAVMVLSWGSFPVLTAYFAQHRSLSLASVAAAAFGALVVTIQQILSTPARRLRRRVVAVEGAVVGHDGVREEISKESLLGPLEASLKVLCAMGVVLAVALALHQYVR